VQGTTVRVHAQHGHVARLQLLDLTVAVLDVSQTLTRCFDSAPASAAAGMAEVAPQLQRHTLTVPFRFV